MGGRTTRLLVIGGIPGYPKRQLPEQGHDPKRGQNALIESWKYSQRTLYPRRLHPPLRSNRIVAFSPLAAFFRPFGTPVSGLASSRILRGLWNCHTQFRAGTGIWRFSPSWAGVLAITIGKIHSTVGSSWMRLGGGAYTPCDNHHRNFVMFRAHLYHRLDHVRGAVELQHHSALGLIATF